MFKFVVGFGLSMRCVEFNKHIIHSDSRFHTLPRKMFHLNADTSRSLTQCQYRVVLCSVQPVDSQFGAGGPFHHGDIIFPPGKPEGKNTSPPLLLTASVSTT